MKSQDRNYIILGARKKYESLCAYLTKNDINHRVFESVPNQTNHTDQIANIEYIGYENFYNPQFYIDMINQSQKQWHVLNFRDQRDCLEVEYAVNKYQKIDAFDENALDFFSYKSAQDKVCKSINIPCIPSTGDKLIAKPDDGYSGGTDFKIIDKDDTETTYAHKKMFFQAYVNINKVISMHIFVDQDQKWHILTVGHMHYHDNCPIYYQAPQHVEDWMIEYVSRLSQRIYVRQRLLFWQFVETDQHEIFNMDFNCRPAGGFQNGTFDRVISNLNWLDLLISGKITYPIEFHNQVTVSYPKTQQFGYADHVRTVQPLPKSGCPNFRWTRTK